MTPARARCGHAPKRIPYEGLTLVEFVGQFSAAEVRFARALARTGGCLACLPRSYRGGRARNGSSTVWRLARRRLHAIYARVRRWSRGAWAPYATKRNGLLPPRRPRIRIVSGHILDANLNGYGYEGAHDDTD